LGGLLGVITGFIILSFYSVIGGWTLAHAAQAAWSGVGGGDVNAVQSRYRDFLASIPRMSLYQALFIGIAAAIVARGVSGGIETASKIIMPSRS